jgi:hypothetical protein
LGNVNFTRPSNLLIRNSSGDYQIKKRKILFWAKMTGWLAVTKLFKAISKVAQPI